MSDTPMMPTPDAALKRLERFVGTWSMTGRTLDSDTDNIHGQTTFEWLPGGFYLQQRLKMNFAGLEIDSLEIIGYNPETKAFSSTVYSNLMGMPLPYEWDIQGDDLYISMATAKFKGSFSADGNGFSGGWRPNPGMEDLPGNIPYDIGGSRIG